MKKIYLFCICLFATLALVPIYAEDATEDTLYVLKKDGTLDIFPFSTIKRRVNASGYYKVTTKNGTVYTYSLSDIESYDHKLSVSKPTLTSFKFNNKFNHQVFSDIDCEISDDHRITGQIAAIGHWLTPSFKRSDKRAEVWLDDKEPLVSKHSRVKFGAEHTITVAYPGINVLKSLMVSPSEEGTETIVKEEIPLTVDMLSTNAPSNRPDREGLDKMLDDDPTTYFHSTWGSGEYEKLPEDQCPYVEISLPDAVNHLVYETTNRGDTGSRSPEILSLLVSTDGNDWVEAHRFSGDNGFSSAQGATNTSPIIEFEQPYSHFRIVMVKGNYKNYLCLAELKLYTATVTTSEGTDAVFEERMVPYGTEYKLQLDWVQANGVPTVSMEIEYGDVPSSKQYYVYGQISIDGAGFYPSMEETNFEIKGRGNSSWSSTVYSKNPYRLKFYEKVKPFGLKSGKNWVLLANRKSGSMMTNAIGMYAAGLMGADGANHIVPVDLYMNGDYWGSYNFTEKVGLSNNSIDIEDESRACRIELDTYTDETIYRSSPYNIPVKIKDPDFQEEGSTELSSYRDVMIRFNELMETIKAGGDLTTVTDIESMGRFLMVNELIENYEIMHPKSTFLYHEDILSDTCVWKWGPIWDLDWCYGYENAHSYYTGGKVDNFWTRLSGGSWEAATMFKKLRMGSEPFDRVMYKYWTRFMQLYLEELIDYCDEYYAFAKPSFEHNNSSVFRGDKDYTDYAASTESAKQWLRQRAISAYAQQTPYDMTEEEILGIPEDEDEDVPDTPFYTDGIERLTMPTYFEVYNLQGVKLKSHARFNDWRNGLAPGIYIVNGKKVLVQ